MRGPTSRAPAVTGTASIIWACLDMLYRFIRTSGAWPVSWEMNTWSQVLRSEEVRNHGVALEGTVGYDQMLAYADTDEMSDEHYPSVYDVPI